MKAYQKLYCGNCDSYGLCSYYEGRKEKSSICKNFNNLWIMIKELEEIKDDIDKRIEELKETEDVVPVIHGRWLKSDIPDSALMKCSVCGFDCGAYTFKYCPMCSAKMGKE